MHRSLKPSNAKTAGRTVSTIKDESQGRECKRSGNSAAWIACPKDALILDRWFSLFLPQAGNSDCFCPWSGVVCVRRQASDSSSP